jgi:hypothetical protein
MIDWDDIPFILLALGAVAVVVGVGAVILYAAWIAAGYLLDYFAFPPDGRWGLQVVVALLILGILGMVGRIGRSGKSTE